MIIGITGGIGSGKTTVSKIYEKNGCVVLKADDIAKRILNEDNIVIEKIIKAFGSDCYTNGKLNNKLVAKKVFNQPEQIEKINSIVHPPTIAAIKLEIENLKKSNSLIFVEAALIFEANMKSLFNYVLLITANEDIRITRVLSRDIETVSEIKSRMKNQIPEKEKRNKSDFIIDNEGSLIDLEKKALFFFNLFKNLT